MSKSQKEQKTEQLPFDIRKAVDQDLNACIAFLNVIRSNPHVLEVLKDTIEKSVLEIRKQETKPKI